jgi:hypothetical protein
MRPYLFVFHLRRARDVFVGQFSKLNLRVIVADILSVPAAFFGLVSQINGAFAHGRPLAKAILGQGRKLSLIKKAHLAKFKIGHYEIQIRPLGVETGQYPFLRIRSLLNRDHLAFHLSKLGRRLLVSATKKAAGQKMTTAAAVARPSLVRCLSCAPDSVAARVDID